MPQAKGSETAGVGIDVGVPVGCVGVGATVGPAASRVSSAVPACTSPSSPSSALSCPTRGACGEPFSATAAGVGVEPPACGESSPPPGSMLLTNIAIASSIKTVKAPPNAITPQRLRLDWDRAEGGGATGITRAGVVPVAKARGPGLMVLVRAIAMGAAGTNTREVAGAGVCATGSEAMVIVESTESAGASPENGVGNSPTASNSAAINFTLSNRWLGSFIIARAKICTTGTGRLSATISGISSGS